MARLNEIRKIIHALGESLFPVCNAFVIVLLIMCVYAILGVQLFQVSLLRPCGRLFARFTSALASPPPSVSLPPALGVSSSHFLPVSLSFSFLCASLALVRAAFCTHML